MERGLCQSPLAQMKVSLTSHQSFAEKALRALQAFALHEILVVRDQDVSNMIWVFEQEKRLLAEPEMNQIAVTIGQIHQEFDRVAAKRENSYNREN